MVLLGGCLGVSRLVEPVQDRKALGFFWLLFVAVEPVVPLVQEFQVVIGGVALLATLEDGVPPQRRVSDSAAGAGFSNSTAAFGNVVELSDAGFSRSSTSAAT